MNLAIASYAFHGLLREGAIDLFGYLEMLRATDYRGCWSVEHHSGANEYNEVAIQVAKVRDLLGRW
jgi:sugar phosphate isomerase/epimerase